jgi:hypothetical protein
MCNQSQSTSRACADQILHPIRASRGRKAAPGNEAERRYCAALNIDTDATPTDCSDRTT